MTSVKNLMPKQYTVIYTKYIGSNNYVVCFTHIDTTAQALPKILETFDGNVWYVFDGCCIPTVD